MVICLVIDLFPFEYDIDTHEVVMHDNFDIAISLTDRTSRIDDIYMDKELYIRGDNLPCRRLNRNF